MDYINVLPCFLFSFSDFPGHQQKTRGWKDSEVTVFFPCFALAWSLWPGCVSSSKANSYWWRVLSTQLSFPGSSHCFLHLSLQAQQCLLLLTLASPEELVSFDLAHSLLNSPFIKPCHIAGIPHFMIFALLSFSGTAFHRYGVGFLFCFTD